MMIHLAGNMNLFRPQMQNSGLPRIAGPVQKNQGLQKVVQQVNVTYGGKSACDTIVLSAKALDLLEVSKVKKADESQKPEAAGGYQKYPAGMFTREEWAQNALSAQRDGVKTVSDVIDYAKSRVQFTMSKMEELENYLNGTGPHSDPNMTRELAETYLHNYRQSMEHDLKEFLQTHVSPGIDQMHAKEYDGLSGGLASQVIENQLDSISPEALGLSNLPDDPREIMEALDQVSKLLDGINQKIEGAYAKLTGGKSFTEPASSTSIYGGNSSLRFFASQMEKAHRIVDMPLKFNGPTLSFR